MSGSGAKRSWQLVWSRSVRNLAPWIIAFTVAVGAALYLGALGLRGIQLGFPLDDAWIHETFARNLAERHEFAFNPGEPSTGSTAPLWTFLLVPGFLLPLDFRIWSYLMGGAALVATGVLSRRLSLRLFPEDYRLALIAGIAVVVEWHLSWAAFSGMETMLFTAVCLALIVYWDSNPALLGVLGGAATLLRPEGSVAFLLVLGIRSVFLGGFRSTLPDRRQALWQSAKAGSISLLFFALVMIPYLWFNFAVTGQPLPTTYYAKNVAYGQAMSLGLVLDYGWQVVRLLLSGGSLVLMPGLLYGTWLAGKRLGWVARSKNQSVVRESSKYRLISGVLAVSWCLALVLLYLVRLPVLYQYGRYLFPVFPIVILIGLWGTFRLGEAIPYRLLVKVFACIATVFFLALWVDGAINKYAAVVKFINDEQVSTALWLRAHTSPRDSVATHDIGAIGFFSQRTIVDTAGLITPSLGERIRNQDAILDFVADSGAGYFAMFPTWYPRIATSPKLEQVFRAEGDYAAKGLDDMIVFRWK